MWNKLKTRKTAWAVIGFVIVLISAAYSEQANSKEKFSIGVGQTMINSHLKVGEVGYEYNDWQFQAALIEAGETKNGFQDHVEVYSISNITYPDWGYKGVDPYFRLGVSYNTQTGENTTKDSSVLIGDTNFRLGVGLDFHDIWSVEYSHHSSAGIHEPNTGIDQITVSRQFDPFWNK